MKTEPTPVKRYTISHGRLEWLAHDGVGPIGIPIKPGTEQRIADEIDRLGHVTSETQKECFLT